ncbi:Ricin B, lectin domain containing protein [Melia azedarach]|uniref:Ricin B, lectin domain containing protein n=1 Tax=Melia azedarach TaxID=155640 RepID=A0ACC1YBS3_MELAZ|nr:Ricin B, lectin domain containing protein [Melia azedarach]
MEHPFGHSHHHPHRRDDREDDDERRERPPHFSQPPPPPRPYYQENEHAPPPPGHRPPEYYQQSEYPPPGHRPSEYYQQTDFAPPPPRPTPPYYQEPEYAPPPRRPPTQVTHLHHSGGEPEFSSVNYQQPPSVQVSHVSHSVSQGDEYSGTSHHSFKPHLPSFPHHHSSPGSAGPVSSLSGRPTVRVFSKAEPNFSLTIRDNKVVLAPSDSSDAFQHWYKDLKYSTRVKDEEGFPCFSLVNKATGQAIKHSVGATHPVQLIPYNPDVLDKSVLWTESRDLGDTYRAVRMVNNIRLNVDAFHGDKNHGGVHDGTTIVLWEWAKGDNQRWKMVPY